MNMMNESLIWISLENVPPRLFHQQGQHESWSFLKQGRFDHLFQAETNWGMGDQGLAGEVADLRPTVVAAESLRERLADRCLDPNDAIRLRAVEIITEVALESEAQPKTSGISTSF